LFTNLDVPQHVIRSPKAGTIERVLYAAGDNVKKNAPVVKMVEAAE
jgi:biotin carboxyl carrier protein